MQYQGQFLPKILKEKRERAVWLPIWITDSCLKNRKLILRMYWDGSEQASVETPLGDFFACADFNNYKPVNFVLRMQVLPR